MGTIFSDGCHGCHGCHCCCHHAMPCNDCCEVVGRVPLQCCEISLWLRGSKESKEEEEEEEEEEEGRPWLLPVAVLSCSRRTSSTAQLFSVFSLPTHPCRRLPRVTWESSRRRPRAGRCCCCCKLFICKAAAAAAVQVSQQQQQQEKLG